MLSSSSLIKKYYSEIILLSLAFLFFFQLIGSFVEAIYAIELLTLSLDENVLIVIVLFSPVLLLFFRNERILRLAFVFSGVLLAISRLLEPVLVLHLKMIVTGLGVGSFLIFLPIYLLERRNNEETDYGITITLGFTFSLGLSVLFRSIGSTIDISTYGWFQVIGWVLAGIFIFMLMGYMEKSPESLEVPEKNQISLWKTIGLSFGLISIFIMIYFTFTSPTVISRWIEMNYILISCVLVVMLAVSILLILFKIELLTKLPNWLIWTWNGIFVISLVGTIISHQVIFPLDIGLYPYIAPETPILGLILPLIMVISFPILLIDCLIFSRELVEGKLSVKNISIGFTISTFFFLLMIFAHAFTTVYDYIPVVGPFFRDKFWLVYLIVGLGVFIPIITIRYESFKIRIPTINMPINLYTVLVLVIVAGTIIGVAITSALPTTPETATSFKVLTYNIRQGNSEDGIKNFDGQLNILRQIDADIIGLQESDIARLSGGNNDIVRYFANSLKYYSYYGPKTVVGTFGIALLSRYPIRNAKTFYMYSEGEQTATIEAEIKIGTTVYNIYVTHLGNDGPLVQQQAIVSSISGKNNIILMGDFNFRPYTAQYNLTTAVLNDSWENPNSSYTLDDGLTFDPTKRIDHIFVSLEVQVVKCIYHVSKASDHPALWIEIQI